MVIQTIIKLEKVILVLNIVTKFHKVVIKITGLKDWTPSEMVNFYEKRAITSEGMVPYKPLSNSKTL